MCSLYHRLGEDEKLIYQREWCHQSSKVKQIIIENWHSKLNLGLSNLDHLQNVNFRRIRYQAFPFMILWSNKLRFLLMLQARYVIQINISFSIHYKLPFLWKLSSLNKLFIKIQYHNIYEEEFDQKYWLKKSSYQSILYLQLIILIWLIFEWVVKIFRKNFVIFL